MQSRDEAQIVVPSTIPPAEYSQTVRLCPEELSKGTRKQTGLEDGQGFLVESNGLQHGESDEPHTLWGGLQTETRPPLDERGRWLQSA